MGVATQSLVRGSRERNRLNLDSCDSPKPGLDEDTAWNQQSWPEVHEKPGSSGPAGTGWLVDRRGAPGTAGNKGTERNRADGLSVRPHLEHPAGRSLVFRGPEAHQHRPARFLGHGDLGQPGRLFEEGPHPQLARNPHLEFFRIAGRDEAADLVPAALIQQIAFGGGEGAGAGLGGRQDPVEAQQARILPVQVPAEQEGPAGVGGSMPAQRPGDLEDYLL